MIKHLFASAGLLAVAAVSQAVTYDFAADFNAANNSGPWRYGWKSSSAGSLDLYGSQNSTGGIDLLNDLGQGKDQSLAIESCPTGTNVYGVMLSPGQYSLHPGPGGEFSVARFIAPATGVYSLSSAFTLVDGIGAGSVDVDVLVNGISLGSTPLAGYLASKSYSSPVLPLAFGDVIDFQVDYGTNGYGGDSTRLDATIQSVPEPASMVALALGGLGLLRRRRRA